MNNSSSVDYVDNLTDYYAQQEEDIVGLGSLLEDVFITFIASIIIVCTVGGNILVILAVLTERRLRKVGNSFIISLAFSDLLVGLVVAPFALVYHLQSGWYLGQAFCDFWISLDVIACTASIVNLCLISYDRFNAITQPLKYARKRTGKRAAIMIALLWLYSGGIALPPLVGWGSRRLVPLECLISQDKGYTIFSTVGAFYLPLFCMLYLYGRVYKATLKRKREWVPGPGSSQVSVRINKVKMEETSVFLSPDQDDSRPRRRNAIKKRPRSCQLKPVNPKIGYRLMMNGNIAHRPGSICLRSVLRDNVCAFQCPHSSPLLPPKKVRDSESSSTPPVTCGAKAHQRISFQISKDDSLLGAPQNDMHRYRKDSFNIFRRISQTESFFYPFRKRSVHDNEISIASQASDEPAYLKLRVKKLLKPKRKSRISILQERRAAKTLGIITGCFIACWLPFFCCALILPLCSSCEPPRHVLILISWLGWGNSMLNPCIYTFFNQDFRLAFKKLMKCQPCRRRKTPADFIFR